MKQTLAMVLTSCVLSGATPAQAQEPKPAASAKPSVEESIKAFRADLQSKRADVMAKSVSLNAEQAAKFWPVFEQYQKEQNVIMDEHLNGIQKYVDAYETLDDAQALAFMNAHLDRDTKMNALRQKYLAEFQKVLPVRLAVRVVQIDRRLSLATQAQIANLIPLAR